jgi:thiol-disulfide isomerase/thioredoxin
MFKPTVTMKNVILTGLLVALCASNSYKIVKFYSIHYQKEVEDTLKINNAQVSVKIIKSSEKDYIGYIDEYEQHQLIIQKSLHKDLPLILRDFHWKHPVIFPIFQINQDLAVDLIRNPVDGFWYCKTGKDSLDKQLNFDIYFLKKIGPLKSEKDYLTKVVFENSVYQANNELREDDISRYVSQKQLFLKQYAREHQLSNWFVENRQSLIQYEGIVKSMSVCYNPQEWNKSFLKYLCERYIGQIQNDQMIYLSEYRRAAQEGLLTLNYIAGNDKHTILSMEQTARANFKGETLDYLLFFILTNAKDKESDIVFSQVDYDRLLNLYLQTHQESIYRQYLIRDQSYKSITINQEELLSISKKRVPFSKIHAQKLTYIDFWASWCAPCRAEMPASQKLYNEFSPKGVRFVYVSIDQSATAWERASRQIGLPDTLSYLLPDKSATAISQRFNLSSIPRYILIDKYGKVVDEDAPRPSDTTLRKTFDVLLKN